MYTYFSKDNYVEMINLGLNAYPSKNHIKVDAAGYDKVYCSNIFEINQNRFTIVGCEDVVYGGIGSVNPFLKLDTEIEECDPFYYEHETTSYGFITRGCIRSCSFCKVPKYEGCLKEYNSVESIIKHKKVKFMDNNILAYPKHMEVFQYLIENKIKCGFSQGLDFRLITQENIKALSMLNYAGEYIFAFDDLKYQKLIEKKLQLIKQYISKDWKLKFYIYQSKDMNVSDLIHRVEWCRTNKVLPYVMRDANCWESKYKNFYIDYAAYCNQPSFFKKITFDTFLEKRYRNKTRILESKSVYEQNKK